MSTPFILRIEVRGHEVLLRVRPLSTTKGYTGEWKAAGIGWQPFHGGHAGFYGIDGGLCMAAEEANTYFEKLGW